MVGWVEDVVWFLRCPQVATHQSPLSSFDISFSSFLFLFFVFRFFFFELIEVCSARTKAWNFTFKLPQTTFETLCLKMWFVRVGGNQVLILMEGSRTIRPRACSSGQNYCISRQFCILGLFFWLTRFADSPHLCRRAADDAPVWELRKKCKIICQKHVL